jgi:hypothetical protein
MTPPPPSRARTRKRDATQTARTPQARTARKPRRRAPAARNNNAARIAAFFGDPQALGEEDKTVHITPDPAAVPRSLGKPPLPGHEQIAEHYFAAVYDRAVATASALAAVAGLIDPADLTADDDE